jgi:fumarylpyruvate hydrolase
MDRRNFFQGTAVAAVTGAVAGCAAPMGGMQGAARTPFAVPATYIPVVGSDEMYPVRRIYCIGRNYAAHSREMGSDPTREPPFFFQKPSDAVQNVAVGSMPDHPYPPLTKNYVWGYTLGLDMTRRDLQQAMGNEKKPWEIGKSFDRSAPLGPIHKVAQTGHFTQGAIWLKVNGQLKQNANLNQMIWSVAEQVSKLSEAFELFPGDIIYSGTPANVGPVVRGDVIEMHIDGLPNLSVKIV